MKHFYKLTLTIIGIALSYQVQAASFEVNEPDDALSDGTCDATCTLRDAVNEANSNGEASNEITFSQAGTYFVSTPGAGEDANVTGDIDVLNNLPALGDIKSLTITGAGNEPVIIDGSAAGDRVIHVPANINQPVDLTIENVTITGGSAGDENGGAILYEPTEDLDNITATLTLAQTHIFSNQASSGGGVYARGEISPGQIVVNIRNSTFSENQASSNGAALGLLNPFASINNSTFFDNQATDSGGAIYVTNAEAQSRMAIHSSTISGNTATQGGGIAIELIEEDINTNFANTILAGNLAAALAPNCLNIGDNMPTITSEDYNIFGDLSGNCPIVPAANDIAADDQNDSIVENTLADNGGPTPTLALTADSIAIDAANPAGCFDTEGVELTNDQRVDFPRVIGAACDVGAFEADWANITSTKTANVNQVEIGDTFNYQIAVTNEGPNDATNIQVVDNLPAEVEFVSVTPNDICSHLNGVVTCDIPSLANGQSVVITIEVLAIAEGANVINSVTVTAEENDPDPDDNDSSVGVTITPTPEPEPEPEPQGVIQGSGEVFSGCSLNTAASNPGIAGFGLLSLFALGLKLLSKRSK